MPLVQTRVVSLPSPKLIKMEERKRPASHDQDDPTPPLKKQATSVNGAPKSHVDADMPWQDDLEVSTVFSLPIPLECAESHYNIVLDQIKRADMSTALIRGFKKKQYGVRCRNTSEIAMP